MNKPTPGLSPTAVLAILAEHNAAHLQNLPLVLPYSLVGENAAYPTTVALDQHAWLAQYGRLVDASSSILPDSEVVIGHVKQYQQRDIVPLVACTVEYVVVKGEYVLALLNDTNAPTSLPAEAFETHTSTFLTAFFPDDFRYFEPITPGIISSSVRFVLPTELCLAIGNESLPDTFSIDFGAENGLQSVAVGKEVVVSYTTFGTKQLQWQPHGGSSSSFVYTVGNPAMVPNYDKYLTLTSATIFGGTATGHAWIYYGKGNTSLTKPLIFSEGFPGNYSLNFLYNALNQENLLDNCLAAGIDVVLMGYSNGTITIEENAGVVIDCIQQVIGLMPKIPVPKLAVGGACMGGVVTRYALAWMEKNNVPHNTVLYYSVDSPHFGISVPVSLLYLMPLIASVLSAPVAQAAYKKLLTPAARELMLYSVPDTSQQPVMPDPLRTTLEANFSNLNQFPAIPYKIGDSNGLDTGQGNNTPPSVAAVSFGFGLVFDAYTAPGGTDWFGNPNLVVSIAGVDYYWNNCPANFDSMPGSIMPLFSRLASEIGITANYDDNAFVPTISALAIKGLSETDNTDLYTDLSTGGYTSYLDEWLSDTTNNGHVHITPPIANFFFNAFTKYL